MCRIKVALICFIWGLFWSCANAQRLVNVSDRGVSPNSDQDQTVAIGQLIKQNPGTVLFFPAGRYNLEALEINTPISILGEENTILSGIGDPSLPMIHVKNADVRIERIIIDGNSKKCQGILVYSYNNPLLIESCTIRNFFGNESIGGTGVRIRRNEDMVKILNTRFLNIGGVENGKVGDRIGANRGIVINDVDSVVVKGCFFSGIKGYEDGDCIHYIRWDKRRAGQVLIQKNTFENIYKRAIKVHGNNAVIKENQIHDFKSNFVYSAISIYGDDNTVIDNTIKLSKTCFGIQVTHSSNNIVSDNQIDIQEFKRRKNSTPIFIKNANNVDIKRNRIKSPKKRNILLEGNNKGISND